MAQNTNSIEKPDVQGGYFNWNPPNFSKYKIPLYPLTLRETLGQLTWDIVLVKFWGVPVKKTTPVVHHPTPLYKL